MLTREVYTVYLDSLVITCSCGQDVLFNQLVKEGQAVPDPKHVSHMTFHDHCPYCGKVLVYERGDGEPLELVSGTINPDHNV